MHPLLLYLGLLMQAAGAASAGGAVGAGGADAVGDAAALHIAVQPEDVAALGGWPLERRWYGLAVQNLVDAGARRVFIDIAFPRADPTHPASDRFFYAVLARHDNVYLLAEAVPPGRDSLRVFGTYRLPAGRFFVPFSASLSVRNGLLALDDADAPTLVSWLLPTLPALPAAGVLIELPPAPLAADSSFLAAVRGGPLPVAGRDVILSVDHPGVTSYIVHQATAHPFTTTALQLYAADRLRAGQYYTPWPWWQVGAVLGLGLLPLLAARRRPWVGGLASLGLLVTALLALPVLGVWLDPLWYSLLLAPAAVLAFGLVQSLGPAPSAAPPAAAAPAAPDPALQTLAYKLRFYEDLERQAEQQAPPPGDTAMVYASGSPLAGLLRKARQVAASEVPVLLVGESGTGKEMLAAFIHDHSPRRSHPFVAVNCASLNDNLIESELFGHEAGAFTGAVRRKAGRFERADGGTLFLDEVGETSPAFQVRLLRVLQEGVFERVGGTTPLRVSVRVIAATNRDLRAALPDGGFREDLFYRLNGFTLALPPLRARPMDIVALFRAFLAEADADLKASPALLEWLAAQPWRGNVRQLKAATGRAVVNAALKQRSFLLPADFELSDAVDLHPAGAPTTADQVLDLLRHHGFAHRSIQHVAEALSLHRITVTEYLRGWVIRFLAEHGGHRPAVTRALLGPAAVDDAARFERKVSQYIDTILRRIDEGVARGETDAEIMMGRFKNTQAVFREDLQRLIHQQRVQRV